MDRKPSLAQRLHGKLPGFVFILMILQPLMDVVSYWVYYFELPNVITLALRLVMLAAIVLAGYSLSNRKWIYWSVAAVLGLLTAGHCWACTQVGYDRIVNDLTNLVRIYQFPLATLCFITFLKAEPRVYAAFRRGIFGSLCIIAVVELLSLVTGTNPYTYPNKAIGLLGWFYLPSAQSAILSCIVPVALTWALEKWRDRPVWCGGAIVASLGILFFLATRLSYLALFATGAGLALTLLITNRARWRCILCLALCTGLFVAAFPVSPMYRNQILVAENAQRKQAIIDALVVADETDAKREGLTGEELKLARLKNAYEYYLGGLVHRYGLERVVQRYNYSEKASDLADVRRMRISYCALMLEELPLSSKLFGMELGDLTYEDHIYDAENDLHGIYYLCGGVGLALLMGLLLFFLFLIVRALFRDFKGYFTLESAGFGIALLTSLTHIYATAGVLRRPNVSIYLSAILACIEYLVHKEPEHPRLPENQQL